MPRSCGAAARIWRSIAVVALSAPVALGEKRLVVPAPGGLTRQVDAWGEDSVRIRVTPGKAVIDPLVQALLPEAPVSKGPASTTARTLQNGNIAVEIGEDGLATIRRVSDGRVLLQETALSVSEPVPGPGPAHASSAAALSFGGLAEGEFLYGFGEHRGSDRCTYQCTNASLPMTQWDWLIQHSQDIEYLPNNANAWIPYYSSSMGYGFLWNNPAYGTVHVGPDAVRWTANSTQQLDYWVTTSSEATGTGQPYKDLLRNYVAATGPPPPLPHEYTGFWQCKLRYSSQTQLLRVANEYAQRKLPLSVIVVDFYHWVHNGDWRFSDDASVPNHTVGCWPDPAAMVTELAKLGVKCAVSVWPDVNPESINFANMSAANMLVRDINGKPSPAIQGTYIADVFNPRARAYVWNQLMQGYVKYGIDTFWLDAAEPQGADTGNWYYELDDGVMYHDTEVGMAWVQQHHRMIREGLESRAPPGTKALPPFLTRAAFAGSQRYGPILWSGDIKSTFDELAVQVQVAQHVAMSGIYLWTTDIGGFNDGNTEDPVFRELVVRWFQFGAFCPIFRLHGARSGPVDEDKCGTTSHNEVWSFGDAAYTAITAVMSVRESLRPYVQAQLDLASAQGTPVIRPMTFDFPDAECVHAVDQYMFGDRFLVAPVLEYQAKSRKVFLPKLPADEHWESFYSPSTTFEGGEWQTVDTTDLNTFPLFVRSSRVPQSVVV